MPRLARMVIPGMPHHVVQRGNNRQDVFFLDEDWGVYLDFLKEYAAQFGLEVMGYCLMTNHVHLVVCPHHEDALAKGVGRTHFRYAQYINRFHRRTGHVWQGRFGSCALDEDHFWTALRYVEQNSVRARMVGQAWEYEWSSAAAHVGEEGDQGLLDLAEWAKIMPSADWRRALRRRVPKREGVFLWKNTYRGWPLAGDSTVAKFEKLLGRRLRPLPLGRPQGSRDKKKRSRRKRTASRRGKTQ